MRGIIYSLVGVLFACQVLGLVSIPPGGQHNFTYVDSSNVSRWELFVCEQQNDSQICGLQQFSINLLPGEINRTFGSAYCRVNASCADQSTVEDNCVIDALIDAGDDEYRNVGGSCDVRVKVHPDYCEDRDIEEYTVREEIKVEKGRLDLCIQYQGKRECFPANASTFNYAFPVELTCPMNLNFSREELGDSELVKTYCKELLPLTVQKLGETFDTCIEKSAECDAVRDDERNKCETQKSELQNTASICGTDLTACRTELTNEINFRASETRRADEAEAKATGRLIMAVFGWLFTFVLGASCIAMFVMLRRRLS